MPTPERQPKRPSILDQLFDEVADGDPRLYAALLQSPENGQEIMELARELSKAAEDSAPTKEV